VLLATVVVLAAAAASVVVAGASPPAGDAASFQRLVGGLGLGPAIDPSLCAPEFDPRLQADCSLRYEPLPAGSVFCPVHADAGWRR